MSNFEFGDGPDNNSSPGQADDEGQHALQAEEEDDDQCLGAVGGGDTVDYSRRTFRSTVLTDEEMRTKEQTQILLREYLLECAERDCMPRARYELLRETLEFGVEKQSKEMSSTDTNLLAKTVMSMGDDVFNAMTSNSKINNWIEYIPVESSEEIFTKVCSQMFADGKMNWGRIAVLFYLAYKLIIKAYQTTNDWSSWIKAILKIAMDFFCKCYIHWVVKQGGWKKIVEYYSQGSTKAAVVLTVLSIGTFIYYYYSD